MNRKIFWLLLYQIVELLPRVEYLCHAEGHCGECLKLDYMILHFYTPYQEDR